MTCPAVRGDPAGPSIPGLPGRAAPAQRRALKPAERLRTFHQLSPGKGMTRQIPARLSCAGCSVIMISGQLEKADACTAVEGIPKRWARLLPAMPCHPTGYTLADTAYEPRRTLQGQALGTLPNSQRALTETQ